MTAPRASTADARAIVGAYRRHLAHAPRGIGARSKAAGEVLNAAARAITRHVLAFPEARVPTKLLDRYRIAEALTSTKVCQDLEALARQMRPVR